MASFVSHKLKLIFCHIPRTGGTSFFEAVRPFLGKEDDVSSLDQHTPLVKIKNDGRLGEFFDDYRKVTIIRHENERRASMLKRIPENVGPKDDFWMTTKQFINNEDGECLVDVTLKFELLPEIALMFLKNEFGIVIKEFPHLNNETMEDSYGSN